MWQAVITTDNVLGYLERISISSDVGYNKRRKSFRQFELRVKRTVDRECAAMGQGNWLREEDIFND